ncbi:hypothetical protein KFE96_12335 [Kordiimonas sp. SCSIO 12603]|uniref:hypothetical protein n=1 Tax=Kordiimonas sp. SCSIO 12603 TaxID=2829596 RepID=UPI00210479C5|nr:hypothetical protein [Kordiimonas sp. SCSIO 12603]UTW57624.1 hypothetical protein KFE96_12335 [Kordiimonas sp. SCSIO 12603]
MMNTDELVIHENGRHYFPEIAPVGDLVDRMNTLFDWYSGVPDSVFKPLYKRLDNTVLAMRENHALAMGFGARLGGARPCIFIQNSGLGFLVDGLFGLQYLYNNGLVLLISNRGELDWEEIQHQHWGDKTSEFLKAIDMPAFDYGKQGLGALDAAADLAFEQNKTCAVLFHRGNIDETG